MRLLTVVLVFLLSMSFAHATVIDLNTVARETLGDGSIVFEPQAVASSATETVVVGYYGSWGSRVGLIASYDVDGNVLSCESFIAEETEEEIYFYSISPNCHFVGGGNGANPKIWDRWLGKWKAVSHELDPNGNDDWACVFDILNSGEGCGSSEATGRALYWDASGNETHLEDPNPDYGYAEAHGIANENGLKIFGYMANNDEQRDWESVLWTPNRNTLKKDHSKDMNVIYGCSGNGRYATLQLGIYPDYCGAFVQSETDTYSYNVMKIYEAGTTTPMQGILHDIDDVEGHAIGVGGPGFWAAESAYDYAIITIDEEGHNFHQWYMASVGEDCGELSEIREIRVANGNVYLVGMFSYGSDLPEYMIPKLIIFPTSVFKFKTPTEVPTVTETATPTMTETATLTPTATPTVTETATVTPTETEVPTVTATATPTATNTATVTPTVTATETPSATATATPTETPSEPTPTPTPTEVNYDFNGDGIFNGADMDEFVRRAQASESRRDFMFNAASGSTSFKKSWYKK